MYLRLYSLNDNSRTSIKGLLIIKPRVFTDERGYFFESYNMKSFQDLGIDYPSYKTINRFSKGVLRGLHFQNPPFAQGKLVRVIHGSVIDVAVDTRKNSPRRKAHRENFQAERTKQCSGSSLPFCSWFYNIGKTPCFHINVPHFMINLQKDQLFGIDENLAWIGTPKSTSFYKDQEATKFEQFDSQFFL